MKTIKLMADYHCNPLWDATAGAIGNIDPDQLPLSKSLRQALRQWAEEYDETLNISDPASSGFSSIDAEIQFKKKGSELGEQLKKELGDSFRVIVQV